MINAELMGHSDRCQTVHADRRREVDVENLALARPILETRLRIVTEEAVEASAWKWTSYCQSSSSPNSVADIPKIRMFAEFCMLTAHDDDWPGGNVGSLYFASIENGAGGMGVG